MICRIFILSLLLFISACGGGGGGGSGSSNVVTTSAEITYSEEWTVSSSEAKVYSDAVEYQNQWGLESINAAEAYAALAKNSKSIAGAGVKIGIVDTGANTTHDEIAGNLDSANSYNYIGVGSGGSGSSDVSDDNGHGSHVSSIAAGVKDNSSSFPSIHGVAYNAEIVAARALQDDGSGGATGSSLDIAAAIDGVVADGVKVINLSIGSRGASSSIQIALTAADVADVLSVAATGNGDEDGNAYDQPDYPARFAATIGSMLAVGSVKQDGSGGYTISTFSNHCGDAMNFCLVAPGESVLSAYIGTDSTYAYLTGTSMSTPHVSGAAASIRAAWTHLTADQTAQILLQTATDLGAVGVDAVYGHGLLNFYEATQAQGDNTLGYSASVSGGGYDVRTSSITTSAIFGDAFALSVAPKLENAIFFDKFGRDYKASLSDKISARSTNSISLDRFLFKNIESKTAPLRFGNSNLKFNFSSFKNPEAKNYYGSKHLIVDTSKDPNSALSNGFSFSQNPSVFLPGFKFGFSFNIDEDSGLNSGNSENSFMLKSNFAANPYKSFLQENNSGSNNSRQFNQIFFNQDLLDKKLALNLSYQRSYDSDEVFAKMDEKQNQIANFSLLLKPSNNKRFLLSVGNLDEFDNNVLNSKSVGAFESGGKVKTSYVGLSASYSPIKNLKLLASFSEGFSKIEGNEYGIFREFKNVRSRSSSFRVVYSDFLKGELGLAYVEPLRVYKGSVEIDIPVARDDDGNVSRYRSSASLASRGKERDFEMFYSRNVGEGFKVIFNAVRQLQPGNVKSAKSNNLAFVQFLLNY